MYGHWNIDNVGEFNSEDYFGFIYIIRNVETQRKYIGKKQFQFKRRLKIEGRINRKITFKESDWLEYNSSSDLVKMDIIESGIEKFSFEIIKLCKTKRELTYSEVEEQFKRNVLFSLLENGEREYYNKNIMSRFFACNSHTEKTKQKISLATKGENNPRFGKSLTEETKQKIRQKAIGRLHSEETKQCISEFQKGKIISQETKEKMSQSALNNWENNSQRRQVIGEWNKKNKTGTRHSEETKEKISQNSVGMLGKHHSEETKEKLRIAKLGKKCGPYKKKIILTLSTISDIVNDNEI